MGKSNCLLYALGKMRRQGGYIIMSRSVHTPWIPHFMHAESLDGLRISERVPIAPKQIVSAPILTQLLGYLLHEGRVRYTSGDTRKPRFNLIRKRRWGDRFRSRWPQRLGAS